MGTQPTNQPAPAATDRPCVIRAVAGLLEQEPDIQAVTIDRRTGFVSLATLGGRYPAAGEQRLVATLQQARVPQSRESTCALLQGTGSCDHCAFAPPPEFRNRFRVEDDPNLLSITRATCPTARHLWRWREITRLRVVPREVELPEDESALDEWKRQLAAALLCGLFGLAGWMAGHHPADLWLHLGAYLAGGWYAAHEVWERLRQRVLDIHFLMLAVAAGSAAIGRWHEGAALLFLFSLSGALEHYAMGRTQREIRALFRSAPKEATVIDEEGQERAVPVESLRPGQRLRIRPGAQIPVDAELVKGRTSVDESNLTGEAIPVEKSVGDPLLGGTINLWGSVEAVVLRPASESALERIVRLIREAQHLKAPSQRFTDRFGSRYTLAITGLTIAMFFWWWLGTGAPAFASAGPTTSAFYRAMTLLVVASPCALVLSIPSAILAAIAWGARRGILFCGGAAVEKLAEIDVVALDKTGTLTTGKLHVARIQSHPPGREQEVGILAYSIERHSDHPLARAIVHHGRQAGWPAQEPDHIESVTGMGMRAQIGGTLCRLGSRPWLEAELAADGIRLPAEMFGPHNTPPVHSEVWLAADGLWGRIILQDEIRAQSARVLEAIRRLGLRTLLLTGDRPEAAQALEQRLRLDEVRAGLAPEAKVRVIQELAAAGHLVAMVGDGVNDAPSLAAAHVGVAMGARGSDAALEQADVVLMHDRLENFLEAYRLSQRARRIIRQNLCLSLGTVVLLVLCALAGVIPLTLGVLGHEGSTVLVVLNSLRLILARSAPESAPPPSASPPAPSLS